MGFACSVGVGTSGNDHVLARVYSHLSHFVGTGSDKLGDNRNTGICRNDCDIFFELPEKIAAFFGKILADLAVWASNMVAKAVETGTNFRDSIVTFFQPVARTDSDITWKSDWSDFIVRRQNAGKGIRCRKGVL